MKKIFIFFMVCVGLSCSKKPEQKVPVQDIMPQIDTTAFLAEKSSQFDSIYKEECKRLGWYSEDTSMIAWICAFEQTLLPLTEEEVEYWDSINKLGDGVIIRGSERDLDTIINHLVYWFTTAE